MNKLKVLDLFSGIGGFSLGLERTGGFETVAFCEIEPFCQKVLKKHWPEVPIFEDVRTLDYEGSVDVISGGYPCQPFSLAGKRQGAEDDRHLWPAMFDLVKKYGPLVVVGENVAGHINMGLDDVLTDLESEGYTVRTLVIPACAVDARHRRDRVWIVAYSTRCGGDRASNKSSRKNRRSYGEQANQSTINGKVQSLARPQGKQNRRVQQSEFLSNTGTGSETMADTKSIRIQRHGTSREQEPYSYGQEGLSLCKDQRPGVSIWEAEPAVGRVVDGFPGRVDRLKALGNAVVPQIPEIIGDAILQSLYVREKSE